uniref:Uncharacterized protein n=1 Tax=Tanacetum cinerariifolium TaxID=118510 RepID=A0A6L2M0R0_TANCI|nr:hypothetical protein [Tanacetum cinerariifolium]
MVLKDASWRRKGLAKARGVLKRLHVIEEALCIQLLESGLKVCFAIAKDPNKLLQKLGALWWYKREEVKTQTWENQEKRKAEMEMKRLEVNVEKALGSFFKGAAHGSTLAMVDAGLVYWEIGKNDEGVRMYKRVDALGDLAGQCNTKISYIQGSFVILCFVTNTKFIIISNANLVSSGSE